MNILFIGLGSIAHKHIAAIRQAESGAVIYALRSSRHAESFEGISNLFSLDELTVKPDVAVISNPTHLHAPAIEQALGFGCPLFIEKPVLSDPADADRLLPLVQEKNVLTYTACNMRFHPSVNFLKKYLEEKPRRINEVNIYCGSYLPDWRPGKDFRTIYSANAHMGGGVHLDLVHELDYCYWLFGRPGQVKSTKTNTSSLEIDAIDYAHYMFSYPFFSAAITLNYFRRDARREIEVVTDETTLVADLLKNKVYDKTSGEVVHEGEYHISQTYLDQWNYFVQKIQRGEQPMNSFAEAVGILKLALYE